MASEVTYKGNFSQVLNALDETAKARMREAIVAVFNQTKLNLTGNRSGRTYNVPGTHKKYTASAPGEAPAAMTGALRQTLRMGVEGEGVSLTGFVGSEKNYAPMLEFGTSKMKPRPWLRVTFEKMESEIQGIFRKVWF